MERVEEDRFGLADATDNGVSLAKSLAVQSSSNREPKRSTASFVLLKSKPESTSG